jgi:phosphatidylethanolamine/phosphatidyl-N-methylethanolamine N-methyltransferase
MVAELPGDAQRVIELGAGTGVFTRALLGHGIVEKDLLALELNEALFRHLRAQLPMAQIYCGDARKIGVIADASGFLKCGPADAIVSGLGLLSMSRRMQSEILHAAFSVLKRDGRYIQFTYGPKAPVAHEVLDSLGLSVRRAGFALWNLPPATVYVLTRTVAT